jgi:TolB-like protein/Tfp pilus assembly protein PilF
MTPERWQQVKGVLQNVLELAPSGRAAFLDGACNGDPLLRQEVDSLLAAGDEGRSSFLQFPPTVHLGKGTRVGDYEIQSLLGAGGMGEVYRARDLRLRREVAIKVLPVFVSSDPDRLRRFEQEATAAAALNHPNILAVYQMGTHEGTPYLVSELLEGETLREQIKSGRLAVRKAIDYAVQIARGLAAAHEKGIVHRDLKPENLFVTKDGRVKILDFGLAKLMKSQPSSEPNASTLTEGTEPGVVMGTVGYMAPEQVRGQPADHRADIFAFGAILYEMLSGKRAFQKPTSPETMTAILNEDPPGISQVVPNVPPGLQRAVHRCLEKDPEQRFQSVSDLAFALETQSDSERSAHSATASKAATGAGRRLLLSVAIAAALLLGVLLTFNVASLRDRILGHAATPHIESLAVLPLENFSKDPSQDYFADGMTEVLIADLSQIGKLRVISRTSVMRFKQAKKPLPEIARELNADAVVEGSVLSSGGRVRITAQLIYAPTDRHLWAKSYERNLTDVLLLQSEVARTIADEIRITLTPQEELQLGGARRVNPEANDAYLRGRYYWEKRTPDDLKRAFEYFKQALEKDPRYAPAYLGIAEYYSVLPFYTRSTPDEVFPKAKAAVSKALELDDTLAEAHGTDAYIKAYYDWDWTGAEEEFKRSLALDPNNATVHHRYSRFLASLGRIDEALSEVKRARELDPLSLVVKANVGVIYYFGRRYDQAIDELKRLLETQLDFSVAHWGLGLAYEQKRMYQQAIEEFEKAAALEKDDPNSVASLGHAYAVTGNKGAALKTLDELNTLAKQSDVSAYQLALVYAGLGEKDQAFESLEKAKVERSTLLTYLKMDPRFDSLRSDPRFQDLLRRMGLSDSS